MQVPLQITFRDITPSKTVENRIRQKARKLERLSKRITGCHVTVEAPHKSHQKGGVFRVKVDVTLPGGAVYAAKGRLRLHTHRDLMVAVGEAFDAARRQIADYVVRRRGD
ncbi:MAG TPA: HPF/RaiA family ribosome-associated protein [Alphaproteobacteria bacterium]|nr:HPF/RaiA family ribosome-associated protein [Alphaproteobacteria bacterium]